MLHACIPVYRQQGRGTALSAISNATFDLAPLCHAFV